MCKNLYLKKGFLVDRFNKNDKKVPCFETERESGLNLPELKLTGILNRIFLFVLLKQITILELIVQIVIKEKQTRM